MYERVLLGKRQMAPFHLNCAITNKQVCRCAFADLPQAELDRVLYRNGGEAGKRQRRDEAATLPQDLAYDMHLYYQGYPSTLQKHLHRKLTHEKERLLQVADQAHAAGFGRFLDSDEEDDSLGPDLYFENSAAGSSDDQAAAGKSKADGANLAAD